MTNISLKGAVTPAWSGQYAAALAAAGVAAEFHAGGDGLAAALHADWQVDLVILDLALATPAVARHLGPLGPRLLAFGDAAHAGVALAANLADFLPDAPTADELVAAVEAAVEPVPAAGVADLSDRSLGRLGLLGTEAARISAALARLQPDAAGPPPPIDTGRARAAIRARRARERFFPPDIFGEPAWDMLLDLAVAAAEGRDTAVSSLCIAAAVPNTTALRWIRNLCDAGLFERRDDPRDARRAFIDLSPSAYEAMARYLAQVTTPWP